MRSEAVAHAAKRAEIASLRDVTAELRDRAAEARDLTAASGNDPGEVPASTFAAFRRLAAADRANAASDRNEAGRDRRFATRAELQAHDAGVRATEDREKAAADLEHAQHDDLTGVLSRERGGLALQNEIDRARRSGESFVLGFVDVDGLKELNDQSGHAAGDALLQHVAESMKGTLRSYDPIVRLGGDEFLCGFTNTNLATAQKRVQDIQTAVRSGTTAGSVTVGLAKLDDGDTLTGLTARADRDMYLHKPTARSRIDAGVLALAPVASPGTPLQYIDALTGTYTAEFGALALQKEIDRSRVMGEPFAVALLKVENLSGLNERSGYAAGDAVLQLVAYSAGLVMRSCDPLIRLSGSTFLCGLGDTDLASANRRMEVIRSELRSPAALFDIASVGVGTAELGADETIAALAERARRAVPGRELLAVDAS